MFIIISASIIGGLTSSILILLVLYLWLKRNSTDTLPQIPTLIPKKHPSEVISRSDEILWAEENPQIAQKTNHGAFDSEE